MDRKIYSTDESTEASKQLHTQNKKIVLVGGCFDVLHIGHIRFLENARLQGDALIVLLESDDNIKRLKGANRPINTQEDRAGVLAALTAVDRIIMLSSLQTADTYDRLVIQLKPAIIATTKGDPGRQYKERSAKLVGAKVIDVIESISNQSTTRLILALNEI